MDELKLNQDVENTNFNFLINNEIESLVEKGGRI